MHPLVKDIYDAAPMLQDTPAFSKNIQTANQAFIRFFPCGNNVRNFWFCNSDNVIFKKAGFVPQITSFSSHFVSEDCCYNTLEGVIHTVDRSVYCDFTQYVQLEENNFNIQMSSVIGSRSSSGMNFGGQLANLNQLLILSSKLPGTITIEASSCVDRNGAAYWAPRYFDFASDGERKNLLNELREFMQDRYIRLDGYTKDEIRKLRHPCDFYALENGFIYEDHYNLGKYFLSRAEISWSGIWKPEYAREDSYIYRKCRQILSQADKQLPSGVAHKSFFYPKEIVGLSQQYVR